MNSSKPWFVVGSAFSLGLCLAPSGCTDDTSKTSGASSSSSSTGSSSGAAGAAGAAGMGGSAGEGGAGGAAGMGGAGGGGMGGGGMGGGAPLLPQTLYVGHEGAFAAYDIATGIQVGMTNMNSLRPANMQALSDGTVLVNMTNSNEIVAIDGYTANEIKRIPSSAMGGTRPVDSYINPDLGGKRYWLALNDGTAQAATSWSATLVDITQGSPTRFQAVGEVPLGNGHHAAYYSSKKPRFVASSFNDCDNVFSVFDFTDPTAMIKLRTITALELGFDGSSMAKTCDPTLATGISLKPHGCATSKANGKTYCNASGAGLMTIIDADANPPTFTTLQLTGTGGGYVKTSEGGAYIFTLQATPKEGAAGVDCQIGQLVTIDAATDKVVNELPLLYKGPGCVDKLVGTDEETVGPNHLRLTPDGKTLFVALSSASMVATSRVRYHIAVNVSNPAVPVQLPSIAVGQSTNQRGSVISGDGKTLFVADSVDGTVTAIDTTSLQVVRTYTVMANPLQVATFGSAEGPGLQTGLVH